MKRFHSIDKHEIEFLKDKTKNKNTSNSTSNWNRVFTKWAKERNLEEQIEKYEVNLLNTTLEQFYGEVRKQNGKDYEPDSLAVMQAALDRHLKENDYPKSIIKDKEFSSSRQVLEGKAKTLRESGLGKKPNASRSLTKNEEETLWRCGELGDSCPRVLQNTVWFFLGQHFGFRGRQEHYSLKVEHLKLYLSDNNTEYLSFREGITKTRPGGLHKKQRLVQPKMFATKTERCPIMFYKKFLSKRPPTMRDNGPFYLSTINNPVNHNVWYKTTPLGENSLNTIMKTMVERCSLNSANLTNHSTRKTVVKKLKSTGFNKAEIINITGHSSAKGLDPYDEGDDIEQQKMSNSIACFGNSSKSLNLQSNQTLPTEICFDFGVFPKKESNGNQVQINFNNCSNFTLNARELNPAPPSV